MLADLNELNKCYSQDCLCCSLWDVKAHIYRRMLASKQRMTARKRKFISAYYNKELSEIVFVFMHKHNIRFQLVSYSPTLTCVCLD